MAPKNFLVGGAIATLLGVVHCLPTPPPACPHGTADCDGDLTTGVNGCETPIDTVNHCGSCAKACASGEVCSPSGDCTSSVVCGAGTADCNKDATDGCEVTTETDLAHCGTCGNRCSAVHGTPACTKGKCSIKCETGYASCGAGAGCSTRLGTVTDCLDCDDACLPGGTCSASGCTCPAAQLACPRSCVDVRGSDPLNCGACDKVCNLHANCVSGACECPAGADCSCGRPVNGGECTVFPQCGCGASQGCALANDGSSVCGPAGAVPAYAVAGSCVAGTANWGGICKPWCATDADCPGAVSGRCQPAKRRSDGATIAGVGFCASPLCDPAHPQTGGGSFTACPTGFHCSADKSGVADCIVRTTGNGTDGTPCLTLADCAPEYYCSSGGTCTRFCRANSDCAGTQTCSFLFGWKAGAAAVGFCSN
jgi:hypothetical protein